MSFIFFFFSSFWYVGSFSYCYLYWWLLDMYLDLVNEESTRSVFLYYSRFLMKSKHNLVYPYALFAVTMSMNICLTNFMSSWHPMVQAWATARGSNLFSWVCFSGWFWGSNLLTNPIIKASTRIGPSEPSTT